MENDYPNHFCDLCALLHCKILMHDARCTINNAQCICVFYPLCARYRIVGSPFTSARCLLFFSCKFAFYFLCICFPFLSSFSCLLSVKRPITSDSDASYAIHFYSWFVFYTQRPNSKSKKWKQQQQQWKNNNNTAMQCNAKMWQLVKREFKIARETEETEMQHEKKRKEKKKTLKKHNHETERIEHGKYSIITFHNIYFNAVQ